MRGTCVEHPSRLCSVGNRGVVMSEEIVIAFLRYPVAGLVDYALSIANLTWQEETAITLCGRKRMTQEKAAEKAGYSVDAMQKWYRAGIKKLCSAWSGSEWIFILISRN